MSISFYGKKSDSTPILLDIEHPAHLNMASGNGRVFLEFLGIEPGEEPSGEIGLPEARRAIIRARATFDRRAGSFTREPVDTKRPGQPHIFVGGLNEDFLKRRLNDFEYFVTTVSNLGATSIYWA